MLSRLFSRLFNIEKKDTIRSSVEFLIDKNDQISFDIRWNSSDPIESKKIGHLLYCLNKGLLLPEMVKSLVKTSSSNPKSKQFITEIMTAWNSLYEQEVSLNSNRLVMRPLEAFKKNNYVKN